MIRLMAAGTWLALLPAMLFVAVACIAAWCLVAAIIAAARITARISGRRRG